MNEKKRKPVENMEPKYKKTLYASYIGYITQAIINNLAPLLFVLFQQEFGISVGQIGLLVTYNFAIQILTDFLGARYAERIGYKKCIVAAHVLSALGLAGLGVLPDILGKPYLGLLVSVTVYAVGGGLLEVLVSPIVEALPTEGKSASMSLLHSFYCWGHGLVVVLSTLFFRVAGTEQWRLLPVIWALVPALNTFLFAASPIRMLSEAGEGHTFRQLFGMKLFWVFVILMICAGASEQAMSQWASFFAEKGLRVDKTTGDLLGPCMFAILMGLSRWFYGKMGDKIPLKRYIVISGALCVASYLIAVFVPSPLISLVGCGLCGLSVGILWPGIFSIAADKCPRGGTAMFGLLALAGDIGCASGPAVVGSLAEGSFGMKAGLLAAMIFPLTLILMVRLLPGYKDQ